MLGSPREARASCLRNAEQPSMARLYNNISFTFALL